MTKTNAERLREYRQRQREDQPPMPKRPPKTSRERSREYRARLKARMAALNQLSSLPQYQDVSYSKPSSILQPPTTYSDGISRNIETGSAQKVSSVVPGNVTIKEDPDEETLDQEETVGSLEDALTYVIPSSLADETGTLGMRIESNFQDSNLRETTEVTANDEERNADINFFKSLLPDVSKMKPKTKCKFKIEILNILEKYIESD